MPPKSYDSMASASAAEGIPLELLKKAKAAGCSGFRGSRVYVDDVQKWIAEHAEALTVKGDSLPLKDQKLNEEIRKLRIRNDRDEGKLVSRQSVCESMRRCLGGIASLSEQRLVNEYPSAVAGLEPPQARVYGKRLHDELMTCFQAFEKEWNI